jgi:RNA polymerase sigma-70 factor (ECF subfamily)
MTDRELLDRSARGDEAAFLLVYERHRDAVFRFAFRMLGAREPAEDLTHDCFVALLERPRRFDPGRASLRTYLFGAVRNLVWKRLRDGGREAGGDVPDGIDGGAADQLGIIIEGERALAVERAVAELPPLQREALVLHEYEELPLADIAALSGVDAGTVKGRLFRARETLRRRLAPYLQGDAQPVSRKVRS